MGSFYPELRGLFQSVKANFQVTGLFSVMTSVFCLQILMTASASVRMTPPVGYVNLWCESKL